MPESGSDQSPCPLEIEYLKYPIREAYHRLIAEQVESVPLALEKSEG